MNVLATCQSHRLASKKTEWLLAMQAVHVIIRRTCFIVFWDLPFVFYRWFWMTYPSCLAFGRSST